MWHLYEKLNMYFPIANIQDGSCCLQNVRILAPEEQVLFPDCAYFASITPAFGWKQEQEDVLIISQKDMLIVHNVDFYDLLNKVMRIFDEYRYIGEALTKAVESDTPYNNLLKVIEEYYRQPMLIIDNNLKILSMTESINYIELWEHVHDGGHMPEGFLSVFDNSENNRKFLSCKGTFLMDPVNQKAKQIYRKLMVIPYSIKHFSVGKLLILFFSDEISKGDFLIAEVLTEYLKKAAMRLYDRNPQSVDHYLIRCIKESHYSEKEETVVYYLNSWKKDSRFNLYVFQERSGKLKEAELRWYCGLFEVNLDNICVFSIDNQIVLLALADRDIKQRILSIFQMNFQKFIFYSGSSISFCGLDKLAVYYRQALRAAEVAREINSPFVQFEEICCESLFDEIRGVFDWEPWIPEELQMLQAYDHKHHTDYFQTLYQYLEHNESLADTVKELHIHQSSLKYRLKKLDALMGFREKSNHYKKYLWITMCFMRLREEPKL